MRIAILSDELPNYVEAIEWLQRIFGPPTPPPHSLREGRPAPEGSISERLLEVLVARGMPMDLVELCESTGYRSPQIKGALGALKTAGHIIPVHGGAYKAVTK
ncbi:MAG: hypothetical protein V1755_14475 [Chloroflexota bacterium]